MRSRSLVTALLLAVAACSRGPTPTPAPEPTRTEGRKPPQTVPPEPHVEVPVPVLDTMASYRVPAFQKLPLVQWGAPPQGAAHEPRTRTYDLQHQVVRVRFDWPRHAVVGSTTLTLAALAKPLTSIAIDAVDMTIARVTDARGDTLRHEYDNRTLTVHLPRALAPHARTSVTVEYETVRPRKGAYFIDRAHVVWTQGEMIDTRYWIPTYDEPNDKTTWEMLIRTASNEKALSNGTLVSSTRVGNDVEWHWSLAKPASTYLMTAVTGNYTVLRDRWQHVPVNYWTYPDSVDAARRGFGATPRMVQIFSEKTKVPYPWVKYDQIVAPDYIFGGMENVTATTQADDGILHPAWAEPQANAEGLVAHELGHQWYGDLVTLADWADAWLNEGFATFMEQIYQETAHGEDEGALDRLDAQRATIVADTRARRPLVWNRWKVDPLELFLSGHIYPRGASVLQMLRHQLGDSTFWSAMHDYTVQHAYGNVVSADLRDAFERATKRDFHTFFDQWVYGAGVPQFQVSYTYDSTAHRLTLTATQVQPVDSLTGLFDADVDVAVLTDKGPVRSVVPVRGKTASVSVMLPAPPRAIRWNEGSWLLEVHDFPRPTVMLAYQLAHDTDVTGRLEAVELLRERRGETKAAAALASAARDDHFWGVRESAAQALANFADSSALAALLAASADRDARVRQAAAASLGSFREQVAASRLRDLATRDSSLFVRGAALRGYTKIDSTSALPVIRDALKRDSWLDVERVSALRSLATLREPDAWNLIRPYLASSSTRYAREAAIAALVAQAKRTGREADAASAIAPVLDAPDFYSRAAAAQALGVLGQRSSIAALEARRTTEAESRVINSIDAALAAIRGS